MTTILEETIKDVPRAERDVCKIETSLLGGVYAVKLRVNGHLRWSASTTDVAYVEHWQKHCREMARGTEFAKKYRHGGEKS